MGVRERKEEGKGTCGTYKGLSSLCLKLAPLMSNFTSEPGKRSQRSLKISAALCPLPTTANRSLRPASKDWIPPILVANCEECATCFMPWKTDGMMGFPPTAITTCLALRVIVSPDDESAEMANEATAPEGDTEPLVTDETSMPYATLPSSSKWLAHHLR